MDCFLKSNHLIHLLIELGLATYVSTDQRKELLGVKNNYVIINRCQHIHFYCFSGENIVFIAIIIIILLQRPRPLLILTRLTIPLLNLLIVLIMPIIVKHSKIKTQLLLSLISFYVNIRLSLELIKNNDLTPLSQWV